MRTRSVVGAVAGALVGIAVVTSGVATAAPGDPSPPASSAPSPAPASAPASPQPILSPIIVTSPTQAAPTTQAAPSAEPSAKDSAAAKSPKVLLSPTRSRVSSTPVVTPTTHAAVGTTSTTTQTYTGPVGGDTAPTDFAATEGGTIQLTTSYTPGADGKQSPVLVERTAHTTKKLGHFSVTDLLLVLIFSAGGVAIAGAGGLWATRR